VGQRIFMTGLQFNEVTLDHPKYKNCVAISFTTGLFRDDKPECLLKDTRMSTGHPGVLHKFKVHHLTLDTVSGERHDIKFFCRWIFLLVSLLALLLPSCVSPEPEKSELVRRLEGLFYDPGFVRIPDNSFDVTDYGTVADGKTLDTQALQAAIDAASAAGGGVVNVPAGTYLSGALFLKSDVELHLQKGAVIRAIQDDAAFPDNWTRVAGIEMSWPAGLINIYQQKNVRITGEGIIDGNGKYWWDKFWGDPPRSGGMWTLYNDWNIRWAVDYDCKRVRALVVYDSEDVLLKDFTVQRSGFWTVTLTYCRRVHVDGIVIRNNIGGFGPSSDGINTDSSSDVLVENCDIDCNDDNLCIKAGRDADGLRVNRPSENIVYRNSITRAGHGLFTLGSETSGGMRNIEVYGLRAEGTNSGIRFKSAQVRGGVIEKVWFHDIEMDQVATPFHFELDWYPSYSYPVIPDSIPMDSVPAHWKVMTTPVEPPEMGIPLFRDLRITRVTALRAQTGFHVNAFREKPISDVLFEEVYVEARIPGFIRHARHWTMDRVTLEVPGPDGLELEDCQDVEEPRYIFSEAEQPEQEAGSVNFGTLLDTISPPAGTEKVVAVAGTEALIHQGDTISTDTIRVVLFPGNGGAFNFRGPLGDGFYITPVMLSWNRGAARLEVKTERSLHWIIYLKSEHSPGEVSGADAWNYMTDGKWLRLSKTGTSFVLKAT